MKYLSKYYFLNILAYVSFIVNIFYIFYASFLCINYKFFSQKSIYNYLGLFANTFNYYFVVFCFIFFILICFFIELFLRKIGKIKYFNQINKSKMQTFLFWLALFLIPLSFLFFIANIIYFSVLTHIY